MIILCGHSGSGKDSLMNRVVELTKLKPVVSYTTRKIRVNETEGISYKFITDEEFTKKFTEGFFQETAEYRDWLYGMAREDCGDDKIVVVNPCGLRSLKRNHIDTISFFIDVPERERLIRLANRGDDITELTRRLISDRDTFRDVEFEVDYIIYNDDIEVAAQKIVDKLKGVI